MGTKAMPVDKSPYIHPLAKEAEGDFFARGLATYAWLGSYLFMHEQYVSGYVPFPKTDMPCHLT